MLKDEKVFKQFFQENEIKTGQTKMGVANDVFQQEMANQSNSRKDIDRLTPREMVILENKVEDYVRDNTKHNMEIFKNPEKIENKNKIMQYITDGIKSTNQFLSKKHSDELSKKVWDELTGFGPLQPLLDDPSITEVMVIDANKSFIEKDGDLQLADIKFKDYNHIKRILDRIIAPIGRKIDEQNPIVDARLPQGFRLNAVIAPIALHGGAFITIRKFPTKKWQPEDLIRFKSAPKEVFDFLELCVKARKNICVSGGTGSGKTTLLNVLSNCIPPNERIITIEDVAELKLVGNHILSEEARHANSEGVGEVSIRDLVKTALRQRPDRIIVGECRGAEALDMLQAMNTGHDGSMTTGHANTPRDFLSRLEYMCMCAGDMPLAAIKPQIASAVTIIVQIGRTRINDKKCRRMLEIDEVINEFDENGDYVLKKIFDSKFKGSGKHEIAPTGYLPTFTDELVQDYGFDVHDLDKPDHYEDPTL